jgi:hypothetical protein
MSSNVKSVTTAEYDNIVQLVQNYYIEGLRTGSWSQISGAFHKDAIMYGWTATNGPFMGGPISNLKGFVDQYGASRDIQARIDIIGITPTTAVVKIDMENDAGGFDYTDFHTLFKTDGKWEIIAKAFHKYDTLVRNEQ